MTLWISTDILGQSQGSKVKLRRADALENGSRDGQSFQKVIGNVWFEQKETNIYCDSAYLFKKANTVEAYGRVRVLQGDSVTITGRKLIYRGTDRVAQMRNKVVFKTPSTTLYTDFLDYDRNKELAYYFNGGKLVDSTNTVTSRKGYYLVQTKIISFKRDVNMTNEKETLVSDTLVYNTQSKVVYFVAPTTVTDKEGNIANYTEGSYNTTSKKSNLFSGDIETTDYFLQGDRLILDNLLGYYRFITNVFVRQKAEDLLINGDHAEYWKSKKMTKIYGNAILKKPIEGDTMYLVADTLFAFDSDNEKEKRVVADGNVRIYKKDLQAICDSLIYQSHDSTFIFHQDPILWTDDTQVSADSIHLLVRNETFDRMFMYSDAFIVYEDSVGQHNQVKGREMIAYFENQTIDHIDVDGNGESIYFAMDENTGDFMGINRIICSNLTIVFQEGQLNDIYFYTSPEANFIPPHELSEPDKRLKGYRWSIDQKPNLETLLLSVNQGVPQSTTKLFTSESGK
jgi:lipopolysaccharide export system protein LptA